MKHLLKLFEQLCYQSNINSIPMFQIRLEKGKLKLNINLGAGESELFSSKGSLNDSQWHHVNIVRREANLTMKVTILLIFK